jgi:hypothetical protein
MLLLLKLLLLATLLLYSQIVCVGALNRTHALQIVQETPAVTSRHLFLLQLLPSNLCK